MYIYICMCTGMIILPVGPRGAVSTHATHTLCSVIVFAFSFFPYLSLSRGLRLFPFLLLLLSSYPSSRDSAIQRSTVRYNIVIFPRAMHFCAPPRALRSFRPIWIRAPCDLELEITQVHHRPDRCLGDLDCPGSFLNCNTLVPITSDYNPNWRLNIYMAICMF